MVVGFEVIQDTGFLQSLNLPPCTKYQQMYYLSMTSLSQESRIEVGFPAPRLPRGGGLDGMGPVGERPA